jgi:transcriptional regulator with XRE-family HTH domain
MGLDNEKVRELREKMALTLQQAADKAGFANRQQWHQVETGAKANITLDTLDRIAAALGVKAKDLLK